MNVEHVYPSAAAAAGAAASAILRTLEKAAAARGRATLAVSGGSTPKLMFEAMAQVPFDWSRVHIFWVDERCVPPGHPDSNYGLTADALLRHITPASVHRIAGELEPPAAAREYSEDLQTFFGGPPAFDAMHLGMGADAHTASLFPGAAEIDDRDGLAAAVEVEKLGAHRITLLPGVLLAARDIAMLVAGGDKAQALSRVFRNPTRHASFRRS